MLLSCVTEERRENFPKGKLYTNLQITSLATYSWVISREITFFLIEVLWESSVLLYNYRVASLEK